MSSCKNFKNIRDTAYNACYTINYYRYVNCKWQHFLFIVLSFIFVVSVIDFKITVWFVVFNIRLFVFIKIVGSRMHAFLRLFFHGWSVNPTSLHVVPEESKNFLSPKYCKMYVTMRCKWSGLWPIKMFWNGLLQCQGFLGNAASYENV